MEPLSIQSMRLFSLLSHKLFLFLLLNFDKRLSPFLSLSPLFPRKIPWRSLKGYGFNQDLIFLRPNFSSSTRIWNANQRSWRKECNYFDFYTFLLFLFPWSPLLLQAKRIRSSLLFFSTFFSLPLERWGKGRKEKRCQVKIANETLFSEKKDPGKKKNQWWKKRIKHAPYTREYKICRFAWNVSQWVSHGKAIYTPSPIKLKLPFPMQHDVRKCCKNNPTAHTLFLLFFCPNGSLISISNLLPPPPFFLKRPSKFLSTGRKKKSRAHTFLCHHGYLSSHLLHFFSRDSSNGRRKGNMILFCLSFPYFLV